MAAAVAVVATPAHPTSRGWAPGTSCWLAGHAARDLPTAVAVRPATVTPTTNAPGANPLFLPCFRTVTPSGEQPNFVCPLRPTPRGIPPPRGSVAAQKRLLHSSAILLQTTLLSASHFAGAECVNASFARGGLRSCQEAASGMRDRSNDAPKEHGTEQHDQKYAHCRAGRLWLRLQPGEAIAKK
jgi:hypothetical protein